MLSEPEDKASSNDSQLDPQDTADGRDIELLLADSWNAPLWKRLLGDVRDIVSPEKLPPLHLTSRPVNVGMLQGDRLSMPWFRTVFTNIGDVISPETLPPLELESLPVDVGELISDQMSHPWWSSLLRNLADKVAPERLPPLQVTSRPMDLGTESHFMSLPRWSSTISTPKVFLPDKPKPEYGPITLRPAPPKPTPDAAEVEFVHALEADLRRDLRRSLFRQRLWIGLTAVEVIALVGTSIWWK
ncbi:MAG: hypothetical protein WB952_16705 [Terriglobales bacterium]